MTFVIDLSVAERLILDEILPLLRQLNGMDFNDTRALTDQSKGAARQERARRAQDLNFLAQRAGLLEQLINAEYWVARGRPDPFDPDREQLQPPSD